jgi:hypothetical protein
MATLSAPACTLQNCNVSAFHAQMKYVPAETEPLRSPIGGTIYRYSGNFLLRTRPLWTMCGYLFASVKAGNLAIIFSVKTRAWRERMTPDRPIPGVELADHPDLA